MKRKRSDSVAGQKEAAKQSGIILAPPDGCIIQTDEEKTLWAQFTAARQPDMWRDFDLILITKMVKLEIQIRRHNETIARSGPIIENKKGTLVENPLLRVCDTLQRQQLSIIRSLSLGVSSDEGRDLNRSGSSGTRGNMIEGDALDVDLKRKQKLMSLVRI